MNYLLETNICVSIIRKKPAHVLQKIATYAPGDIGLSMITVAELQYGVDKSLHQAQNQQALAQFLLPFVLVEFGYDATTHYGNIRATLEQAGMTIGGMDMLIAAQARSLDVPLVILLATNGWTNDGICSKRQGRPLPMTGARRGQVRYTGARGSGLV